MPTTCDWCGLVMARGVGCALAQFHDLPDGPFDRIPYAHADPRCACSECAVLPGQFHHPGCDTEQCPRCRMLIRDCACASNEAAGEDDSPFDDCMHGISSELPCDACDARAACGDEDLPF